MNRGDATRALGSEGGAGMGNLARSDGTVGDPKRSAGARRSKAQGAQGARTPMSEARRNEFTRLHARSQALRARILEIQKEYEAGRLSLDQELALFREIERDLATIGARIHDLVCE